MATDEFQGGLTSNPARTGEEAEALQSAQKDEGSGWHPAKTLGVPIRRSTAMGLGVKVQEKEPDLKEILMMHMSELPAEIKAKVEGIVQPKTPVTEQSEAARLKQYVGQLRDLTNKKQQVQAKVDSYKDLYKATFTELQEIQMEIEKVQKTLKDSTDTYAKFVEDVKIETEPQDTMLGLPSFMELLGKAGVACSAEQKDQMQKMMEESSHKKRRVNGLGGQCG